MIVRAMVSVFFLVVSSEVSPSSLSDRNVSYFDLYLQKVEFMLGCQYRSVVTQLNDFGCLSGISVSEDREDIVFFFAIKDNTIEESGIEECKNIADSGCLPIILDDLILKLGLRFGKNGVKYPGVLRTVNLYYPGHKDESVSISRMRNEVIDSLTVVLYTDIDGNIKRIIRGPAGSVWQDETNFPFSRPRKVGNGKSSSDIGTQ